MTAYDTYKIVSTKDSLHISIFTVFFSLLNLRQSAYATTIHLDMLVVLAKFYSGATQVRYSRPGDHERYLFRLLLRDKPMSLPCML